MHPPELAHAWARAIRTTAYVPLSPAELEEFLQELLNLLPADPETVADRLVRTHVNGRESLQRTIEVLAPWFDLPVLAALSSHYAAAMRLDAFDQQEQIKLALFAAMRHVERVLKVSQARFREVFNSSALGIAITDFDGVCVEANDTVAEIVGRGSLVGRNLVDFFHPDDAPFLEDAYRRVRRGAVDRFREQRRLIREDGEPVWVYLAGSLLHDADGVPTHHVTMVEDISELYLLQKNLDHQLLHDSLTGLPNRQHFLTQLEARHLRGPISMYLLDLDAFAVVNDGLGPMAGDHLLREVAQRLHGMLIDHDAVLARVGGDEFAIVSPACDVAEMVGKIQSELAEPTYVDDRGVALSVSVGVVDRPAPGTPVPELLRAANFALHQAKSRGKRQWAIHDPHEDTRRRDRYALAAAMPGAVENGELTVDYEPSLHLATREVIGLIARLRWGSLGHADTLDLAEETGLSLPIGRWLLHEACTQAAGWYAVFGERAPMVHLRLSPLQSRDEDLVGHVKHALDASGLPASRVRIALDIGTVLAGDDNVQVLADSGLMVAINGFRGGHDELALLTSLPVGAVIVRTPAPPAQPVLRNAVADMVSTVRQLGVRVVIDAVTSLEHADWWASIGAEAAHGLLPPHSAEEITDLLG